MGNKQLKEKIEEYCVQQTNNGLKGPVSRHINRLYVSLKFYNEKERVYSQIKLYFMINKEALDVELYRELLELNYNYYNLHLDRLKLPYYLLQKKEIDMTLPAYVFSRQSIKYSLYDRLNSKFEIRQSEATWIISQLIYAMALLHSQKVPHCNLKPSNVLISHTGNLYITDFGIIMPHFFLNQDLDKINLFNWSLDDKCYLAPERFRDLEATEYFHLGDKAKADKLDILIKSDVFSLSCIIYKILSNNRNLFNHRKLKEFEKATNKEEFLKEDLSYIDNLEIRSILLMMLCRVEDRISSKDALLLWNKFFFGNDYVHIFYWNYMVRHAKLALPDHCIFITAFFQWLFSKKGLFGFEQKSKTPVKISPVNFARVREIIRSINQDKSTLIMFEVLGMNDLEVIEKFFEDIKCNLDQYYTEVEIELKGRKKLSDVLTSQAGIFPNRRKVYSLNSNERREDSLRKIYDYRGKKPKRDALYRVSSIMLKYICSICSEVQGFEATNLSIEILRNIVGYVGESDIIIHLLPRFQYNLNYSDKFFKLKILRLVIEALKNVRFIHNKKFSKLHTVENYIFSFTENVLDNNYELLHLEFIQNLKTFIKVSYTFIISEKAHEDCSFEDTIKSKEFVLGSFRIKNYFINWIKKFLQNINYKDLMLRSLPKIIHFFDENLLFKHIHSYVITHANNPETQVLAIQLIPYLFNNHPQSVRNFFPIFEQNLKSEKPEIILACLSSIENIISGFCYNDFAFFRIISKNLIALHEVNSNSVILKKLQSALGTLFARLEELEINVHFMEELEKLNAGPLDVIKELTRNEVYEIIQRLKCAPPKRDKLKRPSHSSNTFKYDSFFERKHFNPRKTELGIKISTKNLLAEFYKFIFAGVYFEVFGKKADFKNKILTMETVLTYVSHALAPENKDPVEIAIPSDNFQSFQTLLEYVKTHLEASKSVNKELALNILGFFEEYIRNFKLDNYYFTVDKEKVISSASLRQMIPKGHLVATIYDSTTPVRCLTQGAEGVFIAGNKGGDILTYNLENLTRNVPTLCQQKFNLGEKKKIIKLLGIENHPRVITAYNTGINLYDYEKNKIVSDWGKFSPIDASHVDPTFSFMENSFIVANTTGEIVLFDIRQKAPSFSCKLSPFMGVPSCLTTTKIHNQVYIGTYRGFVTRYDLRKNILNESFQLRKDEKNLPIVGISEFVPSTEFRNFKSSEDYLLLTYPSKKNEFAVFNVGGETSFINDNRLPRLYFESSVGDEIVSLPHLSVFQEQSLLNLKQDYGYNMSAVLRELATKQMALGTNPANYLKILESHYNSLVSQNKLDTISKLIGKSETFFKLGNYDQTIKKVVSLPNVHTIKLTANVALDNILLTAGDDRNIRFLNFGNSFKAHKPFMRGFGYLRCFHLSNCDLMERSYNFHYSSESCIVREMAGRPLDRNYGTEKMENAFGIEENEYIADNGLSEMQNYNFGQQVNFKKKAYGRSMATPGHSLSVNDLALMHYNKKFYVVSASEDCLIKIWN